MSLAQRLDAICDGTTNPVHLALIETVRRAAAGVDDQSAAVPRMLHCIDAAGQLEPAEREEFVQLGRLLLAVLEEPEEWIV